MANSEDRLDRIERNLEETSEGLKRVEKILQDMAARQQYHDEAFERHDTEMKRHDEEMTKIREAIAADAENIRMLARIAESHNHRLEDLEGGPENSPI